MKSLRIHDSTKESVKRPSNITLISKELAEAIFRSTQ